MQNILHQPEKVFESILMLESPQVVEEVKAIRQQAVWPTCHIRLKIIGGAYRRMIQD